jgi:hypothetical protein
MVSANKRSTFTLTTLFLTLVTLNSQTVVQNSDQLGPAMRKLGVDTVLLLDSEGVDEWPIWSQDSRFVTVDVEGEWFKLDIWAPMKVRAAKWHGQKVGKAFGVRHSDLTTAELNELNKLRTKTQESPREAISKSGIKVQLTEDDVSTSFIISKGTRTKTMWSSEMENCYSPIFSPNEKYVAFICELNGVLVTDVQQAFRQPEKVSPKNP